ncbi:MAG: hypothetical protein ACREBV_07900, partial [Candidatus Zixiibacteriota bacterium]
MKKFLLWLFVLVIVVLAGAYFARNAIVGSAIEKGSTYALGVETHLGSANLSLNAGSLELSGFRIDNPAGFESDQILSIESGIVDVNTGSVFADTVEIDSIVFSDIKVTLEHNNGKSNYQALLDNAAKVDIGESESNTIFRVKKIEINKIRAEAKINLPGNNKIEEAFEIENIRLNNVGGNDGASLAKLTATIIEELTKKVLAEGKYKLPGNVGKYFEGIGKGTLEKAGDDAVQKVKDLG